MTTTVERLAKLGFADASNKLKVAKERKRKLALAYELFKFVRQEHFDKFNAKLKEKTKHKTPEFGGYSYSELKFTAVGAYDQVPPDHVLASMESAMEHKIFDHFEICHIRDVKDPILFGRIDQCPDRFFIDQWDNDISIKDLIKENEG